MDEARGGHLRMKVSLAENTQSKEWFPASETFSDWVQ